MSVVRRMTGQLSARFVAMSPRGHCRAAFDWIRDRRDAHPRRGFMAAQTPCLLRVPGTSVLPCKTRSAFATRSAAPSRFR